MSLRAYILMKFSLDFLWRRIAFQLSLLYTGFSRKVFKLLKSKQAKKQEDNTGYSQFVCSSQKL